MADRKFFVGGNWKMNGNKKSIDEIVAFLNKGPLDPKTGPLLKEFIENMQSAVSDTEDSGKPPMKMHMYSAHDTTVAAVLSALQVYNRHSPPYASAVLVELHTLNDSTHCVKMRFRNSTLHPPYTLVHPLCQLACCPLDTFVEVTKDRVPVDWDKECSNSRTGPFGDNSLMTGTILALAVVLLVLGMFFVMLCVSYLRQRRVVKTFEFMGN